MIALKNQILDMLNDINNFNLNYKYKPFLKIFTCLINNTSSDDINKILKNKQLDKNNININNFKEIISSLFNEINLNNVNEYITIFLDDLKEDEKNKIISHLKVIKAYLNKT